MAVANTDKAALDELIAKANETAAAGDKETDDEGGEGDIDEGGGGADDTAGEKDGDDKKKSAAAAEDKSKEAPPRKDPTEGMTAEQKVDYWQKRANRHYAEYQKERSKRQSLQRGPLTDAGKGSAPAGKAAGEETPKSLDEVENLGQFSKYVVEEAKRQIKEELTEKDLDSRVTRTESAARKKHDGKDDFPEYDEVVDTYVLPLIQENPNVFKLLRLMDDPGEAAYTLGMLRGFPNYIEQIKGKGREDLANNINDATKKAALVRGRNGGRQTGAKLTAAEIDAMSFDDFEKEIAKTKGE
jgi:hypothetical protein